MQITVTTDEDKWCEFSAIPNFKALGKKCGKEMQKVKAAITSLPKEALATFRKTGKMDVLGFALTADDIVVTRQFGGDANRYSALDSDDGSMVVAVDCTETEHTVKQWLAVYGAVLFRGFESADGAAEFEKVAQHLADAPLADVYLGTSPRVPVAGTKHVFRR